MLLFTWNIEQSTVLWINWPNSAKTWTSTSTKLELMRQTFLFKGWGSKYV